MNKSGLQGIYQGGTNVVYLSFCPSNDTWYYQRLLIGTSVGTYSTMKKLPSLQLFLLNYTPAVFTHIMPDTVVSNLYPELFI